MSSYTPHMNEDQVFYRGVLEYEMQPTEYRQNPNYNPMRVGRVPGVNTWSPSISFPVGPKVTKTDIIGPYSATQPIKAYVTRQRGRYENLRIVRIEKTTGWEKVDI